jgi:hypothetical protein
MPYYPFKNEDGSKHGSFEVFRLDEIEICNGEGGDLSPGWYWQACFPGCLPDGEPVGPFETEKDAIESAQEAP